MRRLLALVLVLSAALHLAADTTTVPAAGTARRVIRAAALPATCSVSDVYFKTAATVGPYFCLTTDNWSAVTIGGYAPGGTDVAVADGGTGRSTATAFAPLFGGTTATGAHQSGTVGVLGEVLTSNGAGVLPTFQAAAASGDVVGPASSTDNAIARYDSTTGKLLQGSLVTVTDTGGVTLPTSQLLRFGASANYLTMASGCGLRFYDSSPDATLDLCSANLISPQVVQFPDASGTVALTTSNVATATALATGRTINGDSFDGTGNIQNTLASADFANQGTTTTVLHGNAAGNPSFGAVVDGDLALTAPALGAPTATTIQTSGNVGVGAAPDGDVGDMVMATGNGNFVTRIGVTNATDGATAAAAVFAGTSAGTAQIAAYAASFSATVFGVGIGGYSSLNNGGAGNGWLIGSLNSAPVIMGTNNVARLTLTANGHLVTGGTAPSLASCGTGATIAGNDTNGRITVGTGGFTACVVTFAAAFAIAPVCSVADEVTNVAFRWVPTTTTLTINGAALLADTVTYHCEGY